MDVDAQTGICVFGEKSFLWASTVLKVVNKVKLAKVGVVVVHFKLELRRFSHHQGAVRWTGIKKHGWTNFLNPESSRWVCGAIIVNNTQEMTRVSHSVTT